MPSDNKTGLPLALQALTAAILGALAGAIIDRLIEGDGANAQNSLMKLSLIGSLVLASVVGLALPGFRAWVWLLLFPLGQLAAAGFGNLWPIAYLMFLVYSLPSAGALSMIDRLRRRREQDDADNVEGDIEDGA